MTGPMIVASLTIYPVKSMRGIALTEAEVVERGFRYDRRFMVVDEKRVFLSQREIPRLALIATRIEHGALLMTLPDNTSVSLPLEPKHAERITVRIWNDSVEATAVDSTLDERLSNFLGTRCRLVYMPDDVVRRVSTRYARTNEHTSFADGFPFLLIAQASLDDLNSRLERPLRMDRFRPNIVVEGTEPFAEDRWKQIRVGGVVFRVAKPCARCVTTTVDQQTGEKGAEPLRTLARYRTVNGNILFGQNLIHEGTGTIRINDAVEVLA
jgi:uncharacterized protein YcbX